ncbi:fumarylacetoacetate (FAA) hydrolase family protein [Herbaspirillum sp. Sphag1AN]|uniref:fumarylacetoacetate hydrolase family protein n=1 Tax=unclassified Herbaspirillum TaxID=2624150 RepID=UPI00160743D3|nr:MULTISPECIES: fumarylacetoacetate hydrolase family protein [unclassified Herbaspirillum]MBB3214622.1 fumarylacetoacetate (FAA) hydrolase family protein [Herbaspirillum sp. Sphag1AN]MBB3247768.1 fumarylacetoacetate (FAA) hydrolase family protein [Herbaspirillum sp. Sphag64]
MTSVVSQFDFLPYDHEHALLIGRIWQPELGPVLVCIRGDGVYDLSAIAATSSQLFELEAPAAAIRQTTLPYLTSLDTLLSNAAVATRDLSQPWLLAPIDLQAVKASGVTFVASMLERVIEEQARGDAGKAEAIRAAITAVIGDNLSNVIPGSEAAATLKQVLLAQGVWSQYLEVGIGPDAEIFTKAQVLSAVGLGDEVGIHPKSAWNNPEPEIVLVINSRGAVIGATLGNDVNLRDFEGRSALLLGKAKDNNASCAVGPFIRLFDSKFSMEDVRRAELSMQVDGKEGFSLKGSSSMSMISRDPLELVKHAIGPHHQYPDGLVLFLGTMFAPTQDRLGPGQGFTHLVGDIVTIKTPALGCLVNTVNFTDQIAPWTFGITALLKNLAQRQLS